MTHRFEYINLGAEAELKKIPIVWDSQVLPDVDQDQAMWGAEAKVEHGSTTTPIPLTFAQEDKGDTVHREAMVEVMVASEPVTVEISTRSIVPAADTYVLKFSEPTAGLQNHLSTSR